MKHRKFIKRLISFCAALLISATTLLSQPIQAEAAMKSGYITHSPLLTGDTMAIDEINPWELECFAVFMSNFCIPFVDSYASSFSSSNKEVGSKGGGLAALQFATGGDINADSIVRRMTTYVMDNLANKAQPLSVIPYTMPSVGGPATEKVSDKLDSTNTAYGLAANGRYAMLSDLFPLISAVHQNSSPTFSSGISIDWSDGTKAEELLSHPWIACVTSTDRQKQMHDLTPATGVLHKFYLAQDVAGAADLNSLVFDMTNAWDVQIPSQCLLYAAYKDGGAYIQNVTELLEKADTLPLYIDAIGNIGVMKPDNTFIIVIPAVLNQYITKDHIINLINAPMMNTLCSSTNRFEVSATASGVSAIHNDFSVFGTAEAEKKGLPVLAAGLGSTLGDSTKPGTSFLYNLASDYENFTAHYGNTTGAIADSTYTAFIRDGFDFKEHLRWSTAIAYHLDPSSGLDIQNYCQSKKNNTYDESNTFLVINGTTLKLGVEKFSYANQLWRLRDDALPPEGTPLIMTDISKNRMYEILGTFQTAAQLLASCGFTKTNNIQSDYYMLNQGSADAKPVLSGIRGGNGDSGFLVFSPIGYDFRCESGLSSYNAENFNKLVTASIDTLHGKTYFNDSAERDLAGKAFLFHSLFINNFTLGEFFKTNPNLDNSYGTLVTGKADAKASADCVPYLKTVELHANYVYAKEDDKTKYFATNWVRIAPATGTLSTAASYLGLREGTTFSDFASDMYYTYLITYGFIGSKSSSTTSAFNEELLGKIGNTCKTLTPEEAGENIMTQGLTAEQKEQAAKDNAYLALSPDKKGREHRIKLFMGLAEDFLIKAYDETCYGKTESDYFKTLTSTSHSFIHLNNFATNFTTKNIVANWEVVMPSIMLILLIAIVVLGTLNGKKLTWIACNLLIMACMLITLPSVAEITPYVVEKVTDKAFKDIVGTMCVSEAVADDAMRISIEKQFAASNQAEDIKKAVQSLSAMSTTGSLMLKQDMTRKVISKTDGQTYTELKGLATAQWLLPRLLSMTGADKEADSNNYVYRALGEKRLELRAMNLTGKVQSNGTSIVNANLEAVLKRYHKVESKDIKTDFNKSNFKRDNTWTSYALRNENLFASSMTDLVLLKAGGNSLADNNCANLSPEKAYQNIIVDLAQYDGTIDTYTNSIGYLQGTESIYPYFYLVARDSLLNVTEKESLDELSVQTYYNLMIHSENDSNNLTVYAGDVIDCGSLEYLFRAYIPYLVAYQEAAEESEELKKRIGSAYDVYSDEPKSFLFECNWADKILTKYGYGEDADPFSYPDRKNREMIFSRCQLNNYIAQNPSFKIKDLTEVELRCIEINDKIDVQWTMLLNYVTTPGVTPQILAEEMALRATLIFNETIAKDRVINENYALYPSAVSLRTINFDTMMKMVLMSNFGLIDTNQQSMPIVYAESGPISGFLLLLLAWAVTVFVPALADICMGIAFYVTIFSCIYNAAVDGKDKLKVIGGASASAFIFTVETSLYILAYRFVIGDVNRLLTVKQLNAGTTAATGKIFVLVIITGIYVFLIFKRSINCLKNFKDMGFQMWASYSKKTYDAFMGGLTKIRNKLSGGSRKDTGSSSLPALGKKKSLSGLLGTVSAKMDGGEVEIKSSKKNPVNVHEVNTADQPTYVYDEKEFRKRNSGYTVPQGSTIGDLYKKYGTEDTTDKDAKKEKKTGPKVKPND